MSYDALPAGGAFVAIEALIDDAQAAIEWCADYASALDADVTMVGVVAGVVGGGVRLRNWRRRR